MKSRMFKVLSVMAGVALVATLVVVGLPAQTALASPPLWGTSAQVTVMNAPGEIISAYQGVGAPGLQPVGLLESAIPVPPGESALTIFVPTGQTSTIYAFDGKGFHFLQVVAPGTPDDKVSIDAGSMLK
jgi:hypothetical protein